MAFALVHFTVGFVIVLAVLTLLPVTRLRLTAAYVGGIWALAPDVHHLLDGPAAGVLRSVHADPRADLFFFHHTLDGAVYRAHNVELTFVSLVVLGLAFVLYDYRFAVRRVVLRPVDDADEPDETT